ncbi:GAF domain-containing sensor histidine kinase [Candidatus Nomurabacteria bacterium]|nr:GAF domain-containing sensor histidine kinase [Candidatus Nomurabacteria bacterium]
MFSYPTLFCNIPSPHFLLFSPNVPAIVYYSHLPILVISLLLGIFIYMNGKKNLANNVLLFTLSAFACWLGLDSVIWASNRPDIIMFSWSALLLFEPAVFVGSLYLIYVMLNKNDLPNKFKIILFSAFLPLILLLPTIFNLIGFDMSTCLSIEGPMALYYAYGLEILISIIIIIFAIKKYISCKDKEERKFISSLSVGISLFLLLFASGNIVGSLTENWNMAQFGLFGMPILAIFLIRLIVKKQMFNIQLVASKALVFALVILTGAQFAFTQTLSSKILNIVSLIGILFFGYFLIRNLGKEEEKNKLENLTQDLYKQNVEMSVKNKTLSLLRKLYQISLLSLDVNNLSEKITSAIRIDLNLETAGVLIFDSNSDSLTPINFSKSERLIKTVESFGFYLKDVVITNVSKHAFFNQSIYEKKSNLTNNITDVWGGLMKPQYLERLVQESHIKTVMLFPLQTQSQVLGGLILGFNRDYESLNAHEKDAIKSFVDVIAVALDKSFLYKNLQDANEKLKSLDKLKTEFLSLASHQLRSPLTAIKGYSSMLLEGDFGAITDKQKEAIDRVFQSSQHLAMVVEDLLNVAKIEQGGMQYVMSPFDIEKQVKDISSDLALNAEKKGLKLTFETDNKSPYTVNGDMEKIRQVVLNLIDNSVKYTKTGSIKVTLTKDENLKNILLAVSDTGMGMTEEIRETLFKKFARGDGMKMNTSGSGLGLYLAKQIVEAHKGHIWVESDGPGKGSTFFMELDII